MEIDRPSGVGTHPLQKSLADEHVGQSGESLDTFPGRARHHIDVGPGDIQRLPCQGTDRVQNEHSVLAVYDIRDLLDRIDESGGRLMVDHANRMRFRMLSKREPQPFRIRPRRPIVFEFGHAQAIQADHLGNALSVHAVIEHQHPFAVRERRHDGGLHRRRSRSGHHHRGIIRFRPRHKELQQLRLNPVQEFGKFRLPMADIRTQQRLPHPLRHIHRSWIQ